MLELGKYRKAIVAVLGATVTVLETVAPTNHWVQVITSGITAALVYLVPNKAQQ